MKLSANTLKRVWGRLNYASDPSTTTLNTLAQYLGFDDWRNYITREENNKKPSNPIRLKKTYLIAIPIIIFLSVLYILLSGSSFFEKKLNPTDFSFSSNKISDSIPNSVVFEYNTPSYIKDEDKLEIQQSWDDSKRRFISNSDSIATSIYYSPGYFMAKLMVNDVVVKEHGLLIPSNGWLGILSKGKSAIYLNEGDIVLNDRVAISDSILTEKLFEHNKNQEPKRIYYIKNFQNLSINDFTIDMVVRNRGQKACQTASLTVYCEGQVIIVPLTAKGCISEIDLIVPDRLISGKTNDLSNFGVDMNEDIAIKLSSSDGQLSIFINNVPAYSVKLEKNNLRSISGIRYKFEGSGSINKIIMRNKEQIFLSK
ncbi:MAG: hypothetical protein AB8B59_12735 [Maribacter sp.]